MIIGNIARSYNVNGRLIGEYPLELPKKIELVDRIREMGDKFNNEDIARIFATMQSDFLNQSLEELIFEAESNDRLIQHDEQYVSLRVDLIGFDPATKGEYVLIIDKKCKE